jgi:hypothetical protein
MWVPELKTLFTRGPDCVGDIKGQHGASYSPVRVGCDHVFGGGQCGRTFHPGDRSMGDRGGDVGEQHLKNRILFDTLAWNRRTREVEDLSLERATT